MISATVVGPNLALADAYATAVFVMGLEGLEWVEAQDGYEAYVITDDNMTLWSEFFAGAWDQSDGATSSRHSAGKVTKDLGDRHLFTR